MAAEEPLEENLEIELGDEILIPGGRLDRTVGKVYGIRPDRFTIQRVGESNTVTHIPLMEDGNPDREFGIESFELLKKAAKPGFVNLVDMQPLQTVEAFDSEGKPAGVFTVQHVDEENDSCILFDENNEEVKLEFEFAGIPSGYEFEVIRTRAPPEQPKVAGEGEVQQEEYKPPAPPGSVDVSSCKKRPPC